MINQAKGHDLNDYLISIVQRIPRYVLLISQILKYTSADHPDRKKLLQLYQHLELTTNELNEKKKLSES